MSWIEFPSWRCAQPSRVGRFLLVMADAYLCAFPMSYDQLMQTPFQYTMTVSNNWYKEINIDATGYTYFSVTCSAVSVNLLLYRNGNNDDRSPSCGFLVSDGNTSHESARVSGPQVYKGEYSRVNVPKYSYEGPLTGTELSISFIERHLTGDHSWRIPSGNPITVTGYLRR